MDFSWLFLWLFHHRSLIFNVTSSVPVGCAGAGAAATGAAAGAGTGAGAARLEALVPSSWCPWKIPTITGGLVRWENPLFR